MSLFSRRLYIYMHVYLQLAGFALLNSGVLLNSTPLAMAPGANLEDLSLRISAPPLCLTQADLSNCDMTDTMLDYVVLRGANLRGSIAVNANFIRSDLGEIDATDADFTDAIIDKVLSLRARKPLWGVGGSAASVPT